MKSLFLLLMMVRVLHAALPYDEVRRIHQEFRRLERTETTDGVPDYTAATMKRLHAQTLLLRDQLSALDTTGWTLEQKIDVEIVRAELNGMDFFIRVLNPWERDPAFYVLIFPNQSDTPEHEGPVSHAMIDLWKYSFPLSKDDAKKLTAQLRVIPKLLDQAQQNLIGNARDLWIAGIQSVRRQIQHLDDLEKNLTNDKDLRDAWKKARIATIAFAEWLEQMAVHKTGPSGVGKENYTWFLRHVLLVPMTWEEEMTVLRRELDRAHAMLALERHHNRNLPALLPAMTQAEFDARTDRSVKTLMKFLKEKEILPVKEYMEPALRRHLGQFQPLEQRHFFSNIVHHEPAVLYSHLTHWFELERIRLEPHPNAIRRDALPFNIWVSRSEGLATAVEEIFMHAGLYDDNPRARELVWIMLAQRSARGIASLRAHANEIDVVQAQNEQIEWTPAGWTGARGLVIGEQHLYLRQPGYGTSYVTGKVLIDRLLKDYSRIRGDRFRLHDFFDEMYSVGMIPVSLIRWQLTQQEDEVRAIRLDE